MFVSDDFLYANLGDYLGSPDLDIHHAVFHFLSLIQPDYYGRNVLRLSILNKLFNKVIDFVTFFCDATLVLVITTPFG